MYLITLSKEAINTVSYDCTKDIMVLDITGRPETSIINTEMLLEQRYQLIDDIQVVRNDAYINMARNISGNLDVCMLYLKYKKKHIFIIESLANIKYK